MLSVTRVNSGQASSYYTADDYYLQDTGHWHGELATELGLTGSIKEDDFQKIIKGIDPQGRFAIQSGGKDHVHTAGMDLTFSAPKSASIVALALGDERIIEAHADAVNKTLDYIEKNYTNVRHKVAGVVHSEHTGNMMVAKFQHISSRELDTQLHTHCVVMNVTKTQDALNNDIYRAMDYKEFPENKILFGQIYRSYYAANIKEIGYEIETDNKGLFEIKGISQELIDEFSKRAQQIQERYEELRAQYPNKNYSELKAQATLETRKVKNEPSLPELKQQWNERIAEYILFITEIWTNVP